MGSASEVEYQLLLARNLKFITTQDCKAITDQLTETKKMLNAILKKLTAKSQKPKANR